MKKLFEQWAKGAVGVTSAVAGVAAVGLLLGLAGGASAQNFEPQTAIPVTFYDFHQNRSNPEFEQPHGRYNGSATNARPNMVQRTLDADNKPRAAAAPAGYLNQGVRFWFRDWANLTQYKESADYLKKFRPVYFYGDSSAPGLRQTNGYEEWNNNTLTYVKNAYVPADFPSGYKQNTQSDIDSAYKNSVIKANLVFQLTDRAKGIYTFQQDGGFFPLNRVPNAYGVTLGEVRFPDGGARLPAPATNGTWTAATTNGNDNNNFAFTMELATTFKMEPGLEFEFRGDDDVWVFINGRLVDQLDLGGIHQAVSGKVYLDDIKQSHALKDDSVYTLHFFYCERHSSDSNIKIMTNIVSARLKSMKINVSSSDMIAGVPKPAKAVISVDTGLGILKDFNKGYFTWTARDLNNIPNQVITVTTPTGGANVSKSDSIHVTAQKAYTTVRIYGEYYDSLMMSRVRDSVDVWVGPGPAAALTIERSRDSTASLRSAAPLDTVRLGSADTVNTGFYAILRDQYGNWVGRAAVGTTNSQGRTLVWAATTPAIAAVTAAEAAAAKPDGQGKATRVAKEGSTPFTAAYSGPGVTGTLTGRSVVKLDNVTYTAVQVGYKDDRGTFIMVSSSQNPNNPGTIDMYVGEDVTLWVRFLRSTGDGWDEMPATWTSANIPGLTAPSGSVVSWNIKPTGPTPTTGAGGTVRATLPGASNISAVVNVVVKWKDPVAMRFFYKSGTPVFTNPITALEPTPTTARMYPIPSATVTVVAGKPMPIVPKLFATTTPDAASWLSNYESNGQGKWTWSFAPGSPGSPDNNPTTATTIASATNRGDSAVFKSTVAHNTYQVRAVFTEGTRTLQNDVWIRVIPDAGKPVLVLEPNNQGMLLSPNAPQRVGEIVFAAGEEDQPKYVYAIIRDEYGNYICPSGAENPYPPPVGSGTTVWKSFNESIVKATSGYALQGEGLIAFNGAMDTTSISAYNAFWARGDTVKVRFLDYNYTEIKIVTGCDASGLIGGCKDPGNDTLKMTSNDDETIYVYGRRSDCSSGQTVKTDGTPCWERITGDWSRDPELINALDQPPSGTDNWTLSPDGSGKGRIIVRRPGTDLADTLYVDISVGPPNRVELKILTPPEDIVAGKEITAILVYYNRAGEMREWNPDWGNRGAYFADKLGLGSAVNNPPQVITADDGKKGLYYPGVGNCYGDTIGCQNGKLAHQLSVSGDTVKFIIYSAADDHQIKYAEVINGKTLTAVSDPFAVKAGDASKIYIVVDGKEYGPGDTLKLSYLDPDKVMRSVAEDEYGNVIGDYPSDWSSSGNIPKADGEDRPLIVYSPSSADENGKGKICIVSKNKAGQQIETCTNVEIYGKTTIAYMVVTRDLDGCGYLDRIDMKFRKPVRVGDWNGTNGKTKLNIKYNTAEYWVIDSVTANPADSSAMIWLRDASVSDHKGGLQTGWTPTVYIYEGNFVEVDGQPVGTQAPVALDGAPPVIESAKLYFPSNATGRVKDNFIRVVFSESIYSSDGDRFGASKGAIIKESKFWPKELFNIWALGGLSKAKQARTRALSKSAADVNSVANNPALVLSEDRLDGIDYIIYQDDRTVDFYLLNEKAILPPNDYINIKTAPAYVTVTGKTNILDVPSNEPLANNRRVPITYGNENNEKPKAIPNPASPDGSRVPAGKIDARHDGGVNAIRGGNGAIAHIRDGGGGTVFQVPIYVPEEPGSGIKCQLKVYDLAGNLVISGESDKVRDDFVQADGSGVGFSKLDLYWNGYNAQAMKVAPGTYRMVVYISYTGIKNNANDKANAKSKKYQGLVGMSK